jgi:predicted metal-dependent phosphoesterase TrpH
VSHQPEDSEAEPRDAIGPRFRAFIDLHCHTRASFDSLAPPAAVVRAAAERGLTHLVITDHDRIDGALEARGAAPDGLDIIVGEEIRTTGGDLIAAFITEAIPPGLSPGEAMAAVRGQGGLLGLPHPYDRFRGSLLRDAAMVALASQVDWVEVHNARVIGKGNELAIEFAHANGLPGVAVSDAHSTMEVGVAYSIVDGDPSTPAGLLAALTTCQVVPGRASYVARALTPAARLVNRLRGNRRLRGSSMPRDRIALP